MEIIDILDRQLVMLVELRFIFPKMFTGGMLCVILRYEKQLKIVCSLISKTVF
jgi:hypothetical protein